MKNNWINFVALSLLLCVALGCSAINQIRKEIDKAQGPQTIVATDGKSQITVPGGWRSETDLNDVATLQAASRSAELYFVSVPQNKQDFTDEMTLDKATELVMDDLRSGVTSAVISTPTSVTINGYPAKRFEVNGSVSNVKIKYLCAVVDAPNNYYEILTWTLASRFDSNRGQLQEVINTFKETSEPTAPATSSAAESNAR